MSIYARETSVPVERSRAEIERILERYGADEFGSYKSPDCALVQFKVNGRALMFKLPLTKRPDTPSATRKWEQACRSRWRALALVIKAKLEAVESGITTFEAEFLAHFVTSDGKTVGEVLLPRLASPLVVA